MTPFIPTVLCTLLSTAFSGSAAGASELKVDADFPGGNIVVERIDGSDIHVSPDLRDTEGTWFYWNFRVRGAEGRTINVHFAKGNRIGTRGPAVSLDGGKTWKWIGTDGVR